MRFTVVLAILAVCLAFVRSESSCLYYPASIPFGGICNGGVNCQYGSYCSRSSVCTVNEKVGNDCSRDKGCELGSTCKGPDFDTQICVLMAHPGQDASSDSSTTLPDCGRSNYDGQRCIGGQVGDSCYLDDDCITEKCDPASLKCLPRANGEDCSSTSECPLGSYCDTADGFECKSRKTSGNCTDTEQCATGFGCMENEDGDSTCVQYLSLEDGAFCDGGQYCANQRCINAHCAAKKVEICTDDSQCTVSQYCNCDGKVIADGFGRCVDYPCAKLRESLYLCQEANCHDSTYFNGSCIYNFCKTEYETYSICNSASSLAISLLSISLVSFFVSFVSKRV